MITLWHNPRCSKSRQALALLEGKEVEVRLYLKDAPSLAEIKTLNTALDLPVLKMMRSGEKQFKEAGLTKTSSDAALLGAMAKHPILIERPIAVKNGRAIIGRPPENVLTLL